METGAFFDCLSPLRPFLTGEAGGDAGGVATLPFFIFLSTFGGLCSSTAAYFLALAISYLKIALLAPINYIKQSN